MEYANISSQITELNVDVVMSCRAVAWETERGESTRESFRVGLDWNPLSIDWPKNTYHADDHHIRTEDKTRPETKPYSFHFSDSFHVRRRNIMNRRRRRRIVGRLA